jgi:hypothetical protein
MRFIVTAKMPVEAGNQLIATAQMGPKVQQMMADLNPEAAYFSLKDGCRCAYIVINVNDASELPAKLEPFFLATKAEVTCDVAMTPEDLGKGMANMEEVVKKYGS